MQQPRPARQRRTGEPRRTRWPVTQRPAPGSQTYRVGPLVVMLSHCPKLPNLNFNQLPKPFLVPVVRRCRMSRRFSEYAGRERDDYPTPRWVTEAIVPLLKARGINRIWEPAAGEGSMADALVSAGFRVISTDLKNGTDFLDHNTWPADIAQRADAAVTNPPYGIQGKMAEKFIAQALEFTKRRNGVVAMLLKIDFNSGCSRRRFFATAPHGPAESFCSSASFGLRA